MSNNSEFVKPYRMGDVVDLVLDKEGKTPKGVTQRHIIHEARLLDDTYEYSTTFGAWYYHRQFKLVLECDAHSMAALRRNVNGEDI